MTTPFPLSSHLIYPCFLLPSLLLPLLLHSLSTPFLLPVLLPPPHPPSPPPPHPLPLYFLSFISFSHHMFLSFNTHLPYSSTHFIPLFTLPFPLSSPPSPLLLLVSLCAQAYCTARMLLELAEIICKGMQDQLLCILYPPDSHPDDNPIFVLCRNDPCSFTWTGEEHIQQVCVCWEGGIQWLCEG